MSLENLTLKEIMALADESLVRRGLVNSGVGVSYEKFCENVEDAILKAMFKLEQNKPQFSDSGEDLLTAVIAFGLEMIGFNADHDNYRNGHCDLLVKDGMYEWYGEAKLDGGPGYVMEGFRQLCDRYSPGGPTSNRGGLIVYTKKRDKKKILDIWIKRIIKDYESPITDNSLCMSTLTGCTTHKHPASGLDFKVRHFPISFYHKPTDKSARNRKVKI